MTANADPIGGYPSVSELVARARRGEQQAWDTLVERYSPLIWSICRKHRLEDADANEVGERVWLQLVERLDKIRDPAALPGWLAATTRGECLRQARRPQAAGPVPNVDNIPSQQGEATEDDLLAAERHTALREAFAALPPGCQQLMALLIADPPMSYAEIGAKLGIPGASIGRARACCLAKLRSHPAVAAVINAHAGSAEGETHSQAVAR